MKYEQFLKTKQIKFSSKGKEVDHSDINPSLFDFQRDIVVWALRKGRAAVFAGTGLGKTLMQCEWARHIGNVLIFAPLSVAYQTVSEGAKFGIKVKYCADQSEVEDGICITNYDRLDKFDLTTFDGIVLDESSILKSMDGKTRTTLIKSCQSIQYKLACTATPAPNDITELCNHAEFLGIMRQKEMLATFFVHDGGDTSKWRLKGHAVNSFWEWVSSWAVMLTNPSDLGYDGSKYILPPLHIISSVVESKRTDDDLFYLPAVTLQERQAARRSTVEERAQRCAEIVAQHSNDQWLIWCNLNSESEMVAKLIEGSVEIRGSDTSKKKEQAAIDFANGKINVLVSKPLIFGMGLNFQSCHRMAFVGLSDSFEQYYQSVRRCWRFGQENEVFVHIITADSEGTVVENIKRKELEFESMLKGMIASTQNITKNNIRPTKRDDVVYKPKMRMRIPDWLVPMPA